MDGSERCETCRFFRPYSDIPGHESMQGECRRYPPVLDVPQILLSAKERQKYGNSDQIPASCYAADFTDQSIFWALPILSREDWCGEYAAREGGTDAAPKS